MNGRQLRSMYVFGIGLNAVALVYAALDNAPLFAATFGLITVYLAARLWMVSSQ